MRRANDFIFLSFKFNQTYKIISALPKKTPTNLIAGVLKPINYYEKLNLFNQ